MLEIVVFGLVLIGISISATAIVRIKNPRILIHFLAPLSGLNFWCIFFLCAYRNGGPMFAYMFIYLLASMWITATISQQWIRLLVP